MKSIRIYGVNMRVVTTRDEQTTIRCHRDDRDRFNQHAKRAGLQQHQFLAKLIETWEKQEKQES